MAVPIAIIGGSGLYQIPDLKILEERTIATPYGDPSDAVIIAELSGRTLAFLPRHGRGHRFNPTNVPVRANIYALKSLGVEWLIGISAVGSLKLKIMPRDMVIPDQIIDRTKSRVNTFFDEIAVHADFSEPFCPILSSLLSDSIEKLGFRGHSGGTYVCMEGPLFSTKAESAMHRSWGASVIGMTALPEAKLAREAEMCYSLVCLATDYDVWHESETVDITMILDNLRQNVENVQTLLKHVVNRIPESRRCNCTHALETAILTDKKFITPALREKWQPLLGKYL
ncbi:S-methyl-5'-thioadenosine phosphorylase [bacterium]|nr:S-methyl-5'-thioadenosine phosphorylase [candidate division CSSED10-310 bacterium]